MKRLDISVDSASFLSYSRAMTTDGSDRNTSLRVGQAAEMLQVSVETLRRWEAEGRLRMERSAGGQRLVADRRGHPPARRAPQRSRRSGRSSPGRRATGSPGIVTRIEKDRVAAVVEVIAGPHRLVSLMTAEAVDELGLKVGDEAVCVVKATNVIVEIPSREGVARVRSASVPGRRRRSSSLAACSSAAARRRRRASAPRRPVGRAVAPSRPAPRPSS